MKSILTCLLSVLLYATAVLAEKPTDTKVRTGPAALADTKKQLVFTTIIVKQWSCGPNQLGLALKLRFKNTGKNPVILSKKIFIGSFMVSRNLDDAAAKKYALSIRYSDFDVGPGDGFYTPDLSRFVLLRQGEVYESEESISFPTRLVSEPGARPFPEIDISEGTHLLQIVVGTWPYVADPKPIRKEWKGKVFCGHRVCSPSLCHSRSIRVSRSLNVPTK